MKKPRRKVDRQFLNSFYRQQCRACGRVGCDPCHIKSRGAGGGDEIGNVIGLCREHHTEQHAKGWRHMSAKYPGVRYFLEFYGWKFDEWGRISRPQI